MIKIKTKIVQLTLLFFTLVIFTSCNTTSDFPIENEPNQKEYDQKYNDLTDESADYIEPIEDIDKTPLFIHYEIKGVSNNLSDNTWTYLQKWRENTVNLARENPETIIINGPTSEKLVALTFDDGPDSIVTPQVIDILNEYNVKGSFFFTGANMKAFPNITKMAYDDGHMVLGHSYGHADFSGKTYEFIDQDFKKTNDIIESIIGYVPTLMRPPFGVVNENVIQVAKSYNQKLVIWSTDTLDWSQREKDNIVKNVLENVRPGEIVLMHSIGSNTSTVEALPEIIEGLHDKGYRIVTLDELLEDSSLENTP